MPYVAGLFESLKNTTLKCVGKNCHDLSYVFDSGKDQSYRVIVDPM